MTLLASCLMPHAQIDLITCEFVNNMPGGHMHAALASG